MAKGNQLSKKVNTYGSGAPKVAKKGSHGNNNAMENIGGVVAGKDRPIKSFLKGPGNPFHESGQYSKIAVNAMTKGARVSAH